MRFGQYELNLIARYGKCEHCGEPRMPEQSTAVTDGHTATVTKLVCTVCGRAA